MEADVLQPGGERGAAITAQCLHLEGEEEAEEEEQVVTDKEASCPDHLC